MTGPQMGFNIKTWRTDLNFWTQINLQNCKILKVGKTNHLFLVLYNSIRIKNDLWP